MNDHRGTIKRAYGIAYMCGASMLASALVCPAIGHAQDAAAGPQGGGSTADVNQAEIVVTATRRSERLLDVPVSISAIGAAQLALTGASTAIDALTLTPGVAISQQANSTLVTIRGVGLDTNNGYGESNVAQYIDGVYQPRASSINLAFADLDRVEVLRGPQGTLYGRNATGGALNFISRQPTSDFEAQIDAELGSYHSRKAKGFASGPLSDGVAARLSAFYDEFDGYGRNLVSGNRIGGNRSYGGRLILRAEPTPELTISVTGSYVKEKGSAPGILLYSRGGEGNQLAVDGPGDNFLAAISPYTFGGGRATSARFRVFSRLDPVSKGKQALGALTVRWQPSDQLSFQSITALQSNDTFFNFDAFPQAIVEPFPIIPFISDQRSDSFSQEFTSNLNLLDDRLNIVLGAYYFRETFKGDNFFNLYGLAGAGAPPVIPLAGFTEKTNSRALFMDGTFALTSKLKLLLGARATWEKKNVNQRVDQFGPCADPDFSLKYRNFSPKAGLQYQFSPDVMAYFTYQRGFKAGGFGAYLCGNVFNPEKIASYEAGIKGSLFERGLTFSLSTFHYDYTDLQVLFQFAATNRIDNAATSKIDGGEVELVARPFAGLQIDANAAILDARYAAFVTEDPLFLIPGLVDLSGNRLLRSPRFSTRLGVQNTTSLSLGDLMLRGEMQYTSAVYFGAFNRPAERQSGVTVLNAYASLTMPGGWTARGFVKNITDRTIVNNASIVATAATNVAGADPQNPNYPSSVGYAPPRTWGIGLSKKF